MNEKLKKQYKAAIKKHEENNKRLWQIDTHIYRLRVNRDITVAQLEISNERVNRLYKELYFEKNNAVDSEF